MNTIKFILKVASPYKKWILGTFFAMSLWSGYIILIPYLTKKIVDSVSSAQTDSLLNYIILYAVSIFFTNIIWRLYDLCRIQYQIQIRLDCSKILTDNLSKHSHKFFINNFIGSLTAKIHDASKALQNIIASVIEQYYYNLLSLIFAIISLSLIDYRFGIAITLWASTFISISLLVLKKFNYLSKNFFEARSVMMGQIVDFVTNISSVRLFAKQKYEINRLESKKSRVVGRFFKWQIFLIKFYSIEGFIFFVYQSFCLYLLYKLFLANKVVAGDFVMIMSLNIWIVESLFDLANMFRDTLEEWGNLSKTIELIYSNKNANDKINAVPIKITKGEIEFKNVSFGYEKKDLLFENFSLKIAPNQKVGLVGYSGSGKTSFANLILRLYDVRSGSIEIDKQDISLCKQDSLRGQIALIPQDVNLFHNPNNGLSSM